MKLINKVIRELGKLLGFKDEEPFIYNNFIIGSVSYYVIYITSKSPIIEDNVVSSLVGLSIPIYWFKHEYEFISFVEQIEPYEEDIFVLIENME